MNTVRILLLLLLCFSLLIASVAADDIGFITIKNKMQADVAESIVGHAYTKVENRFLASIGVAQANQLTKSGLEYEILITNADPATTYIVRQMDRSIYDRVTVDKLTGAKDIGAGLLLSELSNLMATSLRESSGALLAGRRKSAPARCPCRSRATAR